MDVIERLQRAQRTSTISMHSWRCSREVTEASSRFHPDRAFVGRDQVRINWSSVFVGVPDFHSELLRSAEDGTTAWAEWHWTGTRVDGSRLDDRGVTILDIENGEIAWGRLYLEPVDDAGAGITSAVRRMSAGKRSSR